MAVVCSVLETHHAAHVNRTLLSARRRVTPILVAAPMPPNARDFPSLRWHARRSRIQIVSATPVVLGVPVSAESTRAGDTWYTRLCGNHNSTPTTA